MPQASKKSRDQLGCAAVANIGLWMVMEQLLREGHSACVPAIDEGCDLIALVNGRYIRLQVKSTRGHEIDLRRGKNKLGKYGSDHCDAIVVANVVSRQLRTFPLSSVFGQSTVRFTKGHKGVRVLCSHAEWVNHAAHGPGTPYRVGSRRMAAAAPRKKPQSRGPQRAR